jgi:hypothetical protein
MYWRIRKIGAEQIVRQYGLHTLLVISVLANVFLVATRPHSAPVSAEVKRNFEQFARNVTNHLLDTSYITYESSTAALIDPKNPELGDDVVQILRQQDLLAKSPEEFAAQARTLKEERQVSATRIDEVVAGEPDPNNHSYVPIEVKGVVALHAATDAGPAGPVPFHFKYFIGINQKTQAPIIAGFADLSPKPN